MSGPPGGIGRQPIIRPVVPTRSERVQTDAERPKIQVDASRREVAVRTGARVTRARGDAVNVKRFLTKLSLPFRGAA